MTARREDNAIRGLVYTLAVLSAFVVGVLLIVGLA